MERTPAGRGGGCGGTRSRPAGWVIHKTRATDLTAQLVFTPIKAGRWSDSLFGVIHSFGYDIWACARANLGRDAAVLLRYDILWIKSFLKQLEMEMTQAKFVLASLVAGVTLGGLGSGNTEAANVLASSDRGIVIAGNDAEPSGAITENNTEDSANMGKEEDTHTGPN